MAHIGSVFRLGSTQTVPFTSTSATHSTAFQAGTNVVRVIASTQCHIKIAKDPTALTIDAKLPANVESYLVVTPGEKVAAIRTTTSGTLWVSEVS